MAEDRLEKALAAMRAENAGPERLESARERVRARLRTRLEDAETSLCGRFRSQLADYKNNRLSADARLLLEDHLSRCSACRRALTADRGERAVVAMSARRPRTGARWLTWAAAAATALLLLYIGRDRIDTALATGPRATVTTVEGQLYLVAEKQLRPGDAIGENQLVRTAPGSRAVLRLADGSLVEMRERSELALHAAWSGKAVRLRGGAVLIEAAKQRRGTLRVETRDAIASVKGTVFSVATGMSGSRVSVIEGSVLVQQSGREILLRPGEQTASSPALRNSIREDIAWSANAADWDTFLTSLAEIESQLATISPRPVRTQSRLFALMPPGVALYSAMPNVSAMTARLSSIMDAQANENALLAQLWQSGKGQELKTFFDNLYVCFAPLGDEFIFGFTERGIPFALAEIAGDKREELRELLRAAPLAKAGIVYELTDSLLLAANSTAHLDWLRTSLGKADFTSPFLQEIAARYERGAGWLLAIDMKTFPAATTPRQENDPSVPPRYLFLEQRAPAGVAEYELTLTFDQPRTGLAAMLSDSGSGGAAEYLSSDMLAAAYISTREPGQAFAEIAPGTLTRSPDVSEEEMRSILDLLGDFSASLGTEYAVGLEGVNLSGPVLVYTALVNDVGRLETSIERLVDTVSAVRARKAGAPTLRLSRESVSGRNWYSLRASDKPGLLTWTYDRGYMVAASDRGAAMRALAARDNASSLVWSETFQQQLSVSEGLYPAGFAWFNPRGTLSEFSGLAAQNPLLGNWLQRREPLLVLFAATPERIQAVSRAEISGLIIDIMLMRNLRSVQEL